MDLERSIRVLNAWRSLPRVTRTGPGAAGSELLLVRSSGARRSARVELD